MDLGLTGKSVLVLASSRGLGKASALEFARAGACVMLSSRSEARLADTAAELRDVSGGDVQYCACDLTVAEQIDGLVSRTIDVFGTLDVLVNNAGGPPPGDFEQLDDAAWQHAFELNLLSYVRAMRVALPQMKAQGGGRIVNFASSSVKAPIPGLLLSNTLRAGIVGLAKSLSQELAPHGILINTVGPGIIQTDRIVELNQAKADGTGMSYADVEQAALANIPLGRFGEPEEFARLVVFLGSMANTYITGQTLVVDGGMVKSL